MRFSPELKKIFTDKGEAENTKKTLEFFFGQELSEPTFGFVLALADNDLLQLLAQEENGFVTRVKEYFFGLREVIFVSAVELTPEFRAEIENRLTSQSDEKIRLVFTIDPLIIGGFRLKTPESGIDYSFKTNVIHNLRLYLEDKLTTIQ